MRITKKIKEQMVAILEETYRGVKPALIFRNPFELLVAVILSAQCTDKRVNVTTARLFAKAPTPEAVAALGLDALEEEIRDCGLFHNKAKNIMATCHMLVEEFGGEVPEDYDTLLKLPGVGRKTANVVTSIAFKRPAIAVDTHVSRIAKRLNISAPDADVKEIEEDLMKKIPKKDWILTHHRLIFFGRYHCLAKKPKCDICPVQAYCKYYKDNAKTN